MLHSIDKWKKITEALKAGDQLEFRAGCLEVCALCQRHCLMTDSCNGCPIAEKTGEPNCRETPESIPGVRTNWELAQKEVDFLTEIAGENGWLEKVYSCPEAELYDTEEEALAASIAKWETIVEKLKEGWSITNFWTDSCALCRKYNYTIEQHCEGCPVMSKTGESSCCRTPYPNFARYCKTLEVAPSPESIEAAEAEVAFLKSLQKPKEKTMLDEVKEVFAKDDTVKIRDLISSISIEFAPGYSTTLWTKELAKLTTIATKRKAFMFVDVLLSNNLPQLRVDLHDENTCPYWSS